MMVPDYLLKMSLGLLSKKNGKSKEHNFIWISENKDSFRILTITTANPGILFVKPLRLACFIIKFYMTLSYIVASVR